MKKPEISAASFELINSRPTIGAAALAALLAPANRAKKQADEITKNFNEKFIFCVFLPSKLISLLTI